MKEFHDAMDDLGLTELSFDLDKAICLDTIEFFYE